MIYSLKFVIFMKIVKKFVTFRKKNKVFIYLMDSACRTEEAKSHDPGAAGTGPTGSIGELGYRIKAKPDM